MPRQKGFEHSEETKRKMSLVKKGIIPENFLEMQKKGWENKKGKKQSCELIEKRIAPLRGRKRLSFSEKWRENLRKSHLGQKAWNKGLKGFQAGENHPRWKGNYNQQETIHRMKGTLDWKEWREKIFKRDNYRCIDCGENGYLEPHHIIPLKQSLSRAFDINNGITFCRPCHIKTMGKELELARTYFSLVQVQM